MSHANAALTPKARLRLGWLVVEEGWPVGSIGSEICARVATDAFDYLDAPPLKITGADVPMPYAANLEKLALPSVDQVIAAVKSVCYRT